MSSPPAGMHFQGWVHFKPSQTGPWSTSLAGKGPELVREMKRYQLDIVGLTSMHITGSGTKLLEKGWTLAFSPVAQSQRRRAGVGTHKSLAASRSGKGSGCC